jgi:hypothetical protein
VTVAHPGKPVVIGFDARAITEPDAATLDALVRMQLEARRLGASIELRNAPRILVDLLAGAGLAGVLPVAASSVFDADGQVEEREQARVDEEVHPDDEIA